MRSASDPKVSPRAFACFFIPFFALGIFFTVMLLRDAIASAATYTWQPAQCRIIESEVREATSPSPWFAYLRYISSTGESVRSSRAFPTYRDALLFTRRWPAGSSATCYLDPRDPSGALLERKGAGLAILLFLPIPLLFVFIGAAGFYTVVFRVQPHARVRPAPKPRAAGRFVAALLTLVGLVLTVAFLLGPMRHAIALRSWRAQDCKILRSDILRRHTNKGGDAYSPAILYSYAVADREHRSDAIDFFSFPTTSWTSAQIIIDRYPQGSSATCYVNPADPDEATLNRAPLSPCYPQACLSGSGNDLTLRDKVAFPLAMSYSERRSHLSSVCLPAIVNSMIARSPVRRDR